MGMEAAMHCDTGGRGKGQQKAADKQGERALGGQARAPP